MIKETQRENQNTGTLWRSGNDSADATSMAYDNYTIFYEVVAEPNFRPFLCFFLDFKALSMDSLDLEDSR
jgi:hypothetical protein